MVGFACAVAAETARTDVPALITAAFEGVEVRKDNADDATPAAELSPRGPIFDGAPT